MKKFFASLMMLAALFFPTATAADYGLPSGIQQGNILHCFDWTMAEVEANLANIANAGFGAVQLSPLQRSDISVGTSWHHLYRPYDMAFKSSGMGSEQDLKDLCSAAAQYGIKVIVDVVANHVDKTSGYHDTWWDSNGRVRWEGGCQYNSRYSITHGQLGDYGDINSELAEVAARGKAYVEFLKNCGVKGIRWDAAKHIGLPSEGCNFWTEVTSVPGMWHYGEILDNPGPDASIIKEYAKYMSVTDNEYCNYAARDNGGLPGGYGGSWAVNYGLGDKCVYWGESHDTYSNDDWSCNRDQATVDRAYAAYACRNDATALYFARPNTKGFNNIKVGKGTDAYKSAHIAAVNKFRNACVGSKDYFSNGNNAISVTREGHGAVIVMKGSGNVSIANGGGYCPAGTYTDMVSGGTFTVTSTTISGNVGSSGIAVILKDNPNPDPDPDPDPDPAPDPSASYWLLGNIDGAAGWGTTPGTGVEMTASNGKYVASNVKMVLASGQTSCYFNITDKVGSTWDALNQTANRYGAATEGAPITIGTPATVVKYALNVDASGCLSWTVAPGTYDFTFDPSAMTLTVTTTGDNPDPDPDPDPNPGTLTITGDYNLAYSGSKSMVYYWPVSSPTWPGVKMATVTGSDGNTYKCYKVPSGTTGILFNNGGNDSKTSDLTYTGSYVMNDSGATSTAVVFKGGDNPDPDPVPSGDHYVYFDGTKFAQPQVWAWTDTENCTTAGTWGGDDMTKKDGKWYWEVPSGKPVPTMIIIHEGDNKIGGGDLVYVDKATYHQDGSYTEAGDDPTPAKPVVTISPNGGRFTSTQSVTLSVNPSTASIYYTIDGSNPTASSTKYTGAFTLSSTATVKAVGIGADNVAGDVVSATFTKTENPDPVPGDNLITDYYKVNPNGQAGSNRTVNMTFSGQKSTSALSNWTEADLIAQGVARDVAQAYKGNHEYPVVDSYALYAAYDNENLYIGIQYVYTVWDLYGDGKLPSQAKPYNFDGKLCLAFDLDPNVSFDGYINGQYPIWMDNGMVGAKYNNGVDAVFMASTKPGVGTPGFFISTADGHASYASAYCKTFTGAYGYADGLLPSISAVYGQAEFNGDPEDLKGNDGFVDLRSEISDEAHTFYELKLPLSMLGITESYIRNNGIGVMTVDIYGNSPHGGVPYDPSYFDNVKESYSQDGSSSKEKEDEDIITYAPARIGHISAGIDDIFGDEAENLDAPVEYYNLQGMRVSEPSAPGLYIRRQGKNVEKILVR